MNVFNRVLLIILLTGVTILALAVILFAWVSTESAVEVLDEAVDWLQDNQGDLEKTLVSSGAGLVALLAMTLLYLELVPHAGSDVGVIDLKGGSATLSTDAVAQRIEESIARVPYVSDAKVYVEGKHKGVSVSLDVNVDPQANLAQVTDEVCDVVRDVLANRVHVALLDAPTVRLHYREPRTGRQPARRPPLNATSARGELQEPLLEERTPALVGPRRGLPTRQEADAHPFNGLAPTTRSSAPPISPRPVDQRNTWTPEPPHRGEPLYSRPDLDEPPHRPDPGYESPEPDIPAPGPASASSPPAQSDWRSDYAVEEAPPAPEETPRDEDRPADDDRPRPPEPYRGNV